MPNGWRDAGHPGSPGTPPTAPAPPTHVEDQQRPVLHHRHVLHVVAPDVHLHLDLLQVQQQLELLLVVPRLQGGLQQRPAGSRDITVPRGHLGQGAAGGRRRAGWRCPPPRHSPHGSPAGAGTGIGSEQDRVLEALRVLVGAQRDLPLQFVFQGAGWRGQRCCRDCRAGLPPRGCNHPRPQQAGCPQPRCHQPSHRDQALSRCARQPGPKELSLIPAGEQAGALCAGWQQVTPPCTCWGGCRPR